MSPGDIWDEFLAMIAVCILHFVEIAITIALYVAMIAGVWILLQWLVG